MRSPDVRPPCSVPASEGVRFSRDKLPSRRGPAVAEKPPESFLGYLSADLLSSPVDYLETCRESWASSVSTMVQCALSLQYERLGARFTNRSMSSSFLLSCFEVGPSDACGCLGGDPPAVLKELARQGLVTFSQFPYYTSANLGAKLHSDIDVDYVCRNRDRNGSCRPCADAAEYQEAVLAAPGERGSIRFLVPCMPCSTPQAPRYYPEAPFIVGAPSKEDRQEAIKAELTRLGPLCSTLALDEEAFSSLSSTGGSAPLVLDAGDGLFYQPQQPPPSSAHHVVLLVGYKDGGSRGRAPFWICQNQNGGSNFGYSISDRGTLIKGLFNVSMEDGASRILEQTISFEKMLIKTDPKAGKKDLSAGDPFVAPLADKPLARLAAAETGAVQPKSPPDARLWTEWWPWLISALLALFFLALAVATFASSSSE